jgi:hypothetical protein
MKGPCSSGFRVKVRMKVNSPSVVKSPLKRAENVERPTMVFVHQRWVKCGMRERAVARTNILADAD